MLLGEILHIDAVKLRLEAVNKYEVIGELVDALIQAHEIPKNLRAHFIDNIEKRERAMSTGLEHGVGLPHTSSEHVDTPIAAIGISEAGVPFSTLDGKPVHIAVLLILPRRQFQFNVRTLAAIAHLLDHRDLRAQLLQATSPQEVLTIIQAAEEGHTFARYRTT